MATPDISTKEILHHSMTLMGMEMTTQRRARWGLNYMSDLLTRHGITSETLEFGAGKVLIAEVGPPDAPLRVDWCGHLDVVPGVADQFRPRVVGRRLIGRGSYDMLAAAVTMVETLPYADEAGQGLVRTRLVLVDREEGDSPAPFAAYMDAVRGSGTVPDVVLVGEPTNLQVARAVKSAIFLKFTIHGVGGHSSIPFRLSSPITWARRLQQILEEQMDFINEVSDDYPEGPSVAVTAIQAGGEPGTQPTIPDEAWFWATIRLFPGQDTDRILRTIQRRVKEVDRLMLAEQQRRHLTPPPARVTLETSLVRPAYSVDPDNPFVGALCDAVRRHLPKGAPVLCVRHGAGDIGFAGKVPAVEWGVAGEGHHGSNEWADIDSFGPYALAYLAYVGILADTVGRSPEVLKRLQVPPAVAMPQAAPRPSELVRSRVRVST